MQPMLNEEQVVVVYAAPKSYLNKMDVSGIEKFSSWLLIWQSCLAADHMPCCSGIAAISLTKAGQGFVNGGGLFLQATQADGI